MTATEEKSMSIYNRAALISKIALGSFLTVGIAAAADAACVCRCVNGEMKPICETSIVVPPVCPPTVCPVVPPRVEPIQAPRVPPVGTKECRQEQVLNPYTRQYEWKTICR